MDYCGDLNKINLAIKNDQDCRFKNKNCFSKGQTWKNCWETLEKDLVKNGADLGLSNLQKKIEGYYVNQNMIQDFLGINIKNNYKEENDLPTSKRIFFSNFFSNLNFF